jgi:hypothetical protein
MTYKIIIDNITRAEIFQSGRVAENMHLNAYMVIYQYKSNIIKKNHKTRNENRKLAVKDIIESKGILKI